MPHSNFEADEYAVVHGTISFARVVSQIDGAELEARNKRPGAYEKTRPYTTLTLSDPQVMPTAANGTMNSLEQYIATSMIRDAKPGTKDYGHKIVTFNNSSPSLPNIVITDDATKTSKRTHPKHDPARGQEVLAVIRSFASSNPNHQNGSSLDSIIFTKPYQEYIPAGSSGPGQFTVDLLSKYGFTVLPDDDETTDAQPSQPVQAAATDATPQPQAPTFGAAQPQSQQPQAPAFNAAQPFGAAPQQAQPFGATQPFGVAPQQASAPAQAQPFGAAQPFGVTPQQVSAPQQAQPFGAAQPFGVAPQQASAPAQAQPVTSPILQQAQQQAKQAAETAQATTPATFDQTAFPQGSGVVNTPKGAFWDPRMSMGQNQ